MHLECQLPVKRITLCVINGLSRSNVLRARLPLRVSAGKRAKGSEVRHEERLRSLWEHSKMRRKNSRVNRDSAGEIKRNTKARTKRRGSISRRSSDFRECKQEMSKRYSSNTSHTYGIRDWAELKFSCSSSQPPDWGWVARGTRSALRASSGTRHGVEAGTVTYLRSACFASWGWTGMLWCAECSPCEPPNRKLKPRKW